MVRHRGEIALFQSPNRATCPPDKRGTAGRTSALPGALNVIPGAAQLSIDVRSPDDAIAREPCAAANADDLAAGCQVLLQFVRNFKPKGTPST